MVRRGTPLGQDGACAGGGGVGYVQTISILHQSTLLPSTLSVYGKSIAIEDMQLTSCGQFWNLMHRITEELRLGSKIKKNTS